jgi:hypothetical protein
MSTRRPFTRRPAGRTVQLSGLSTGVRPFRVQRDDDEVGPSAKAEDDAAGVLDSYLAKRQVARTVPPAGAWSADEGTIQTKPVDGSAPPSIQRRPTDFAAASVLTIEPGSGGSVLGGLLSAFHSKFPSPWAKLRTLVRDYSALNAIAIRRRNDKLIEIHDTIEEWKRHHNVATKDKPSENEQQKLRAIGELEDLVMADFAETDAASISVTATGETAVHTWSATHPPREGESVDDYLDRFQVDLEAGGRILGALVAHNLRNGLGILDAAGARQKLWDYGQAVPRTKAMPAYLIDFKAWLWLQAPKTLATAEAITALESFYAIGDGKQVDLYIDANLLVKTAVSAQVLGGTKADGQIHVYDTATWPDALADYLEGTDNRATGLPYTRQEALLKAATVHGFQDATGSHLHAAESDIYVAIHEAMHLYQNEAFCDVVGWQVKEGMADYFAQNIATQQRIVPRQSYRRPRGAIVKLVAVSGEDLVANAFFKGRGRALETDVNAKQGADTFQSWVGFMKASQYDSADALL